MTLNNSPIKRKLMRIILLTSGAVLILTCAALFIYEFIAFRQSGKNQLAILGEIIAANSTAALAFGDQENAYEILEALKAEKQVVAACLYDTAGKIFARYPLYLPNAGFPDKPHQKGYKYANSFLEGYQPVQQKGQLLGTLYLRSDMKALADRFQLYGFIVFIVVAVSSLLAFFLSRRLQQTISGPILSLADTAAIISQKHDYTVRAEKMADDELGLLTDAFNQMLTQIEEQNKEITAFNHDLENKVLERTTELQQAYNDLKVQNDFVQAIFDASVHHIAVVDRNMKFTTINEMVEKLYGVKKNEVLGKSYVEVFPAAKDSKSFNDIKAALQGEYIHNTITQSALVNGYFENHMIPLKNKGQVYAVLILSHNITEIVEANEKLMKVNSALEKSNYDLEQFAYVASHDLQEPLRKIQIFSQYALQNANSREDLEKYLTKIIFSAGRMSFLIKAVLNYSRLSNSNDFFESVDLNQIVESIKTDLELVILEKEAAINITHLPVIKGINLQLNQLFLNLISNSLKFSEEKPVITITSKFVEAREIKEVELQSDITYAEIILQDNGIGFEQQYANKIFNVFQRLHNKNQFPGTGIGLALCKKIVDNHNGFISAKGAPGEGAAFYIYLPAET